MSQTMNNLTYMPDSLFYTLLNNNFPFSTSTTNYISNNMNLNAYWSNNITTLPNFLDYAMSVDLSNN